MTAKSEFTPFGFIYCVTNKISGKCYVGQTTRPIEFRWRQHCSKTGSATLLGKAVLKYGKDSFSVDQLATASSREELNAKEVFFIQLMSARDRHIGYNLAEGGGVVYRVLSDLHKARIGASNKVVKRGPLSEEQRSKIGAAHKGVPKVVSPEAKIRMAEMLRNRVLSSETLRKMSESHKDKVQSKETIEKRAASHRGRKNTEETKALMSKSAKGVAKSEAHKASLRAASKLRWERYRLAKAAQI